SGEIALYQNWTDIQIPTGENMTVTGFIGLYKGNAQVLAATVTSASGKEVVATPKFSVAEGEVAEGTEVAITSATEGATIYYTVDGTNPTAASTVYSTPVVINEALTIKAIAVKDGMDDSALATAAYTIKAPVVVAGNQAMFNFAAPTTLDPDYTVPADLGQSGLVAEVPSVTFSNNGISVVTVDGSSTARLWKCGTQGHAVEYRVYNGATTTISAQEGLLIKSVEFTGAQLTALCYNNTALEGATSTSWTSEEGVKSVEFKCVTNGSYKRADIATIKVTFEKASDSIADVELDENAPAEYYNLQGVRMEGELTPGLYIRRQGNKTAKVIVK
ncbi:MAG: chitobiase/beta-hexosaminidase C-terminal domain-containing protein, partial [Muribaculaceae bacterium]|nr:chitobiase/beta-hexosaminidase C-terminal domain-containing protein [Muribaculaceae bacterium]